MTLKADILSRFSGGGGGGDIPLYLPDLTLWYDWHRKQNSLPDKWQGYSLPQVARALGVPIWLPARPWRIETPGVEVTKTEQDQERVIKAETSQGTLIARWVVGPDGDWWQSEYPVKTAGDLAAALELAQARTYVLDSSELTALEAEVGNDGILALEIPRRPYSDILHEMLGWSEGLMFLAEPAIPEINAILEAKLQAFVRKIAKLPGTVVLSPDNLDGQFIPPATFDEYLAGSYRQTTEVLHLADKLLVVHVGGPLKHLLLPMVEAGIDVIEGVCGPPQSNLPLPEAREMAGPDVTLWGGIAQDFLLDMHDRAKFEAAVQQVTREVKGDSRMILGVADRFPTEAELDRLEAIPELVAQAI
jgi:hypothetical protein